jgi:hypothetical protein
MLAAPELLGLKGTKLDILEVSQKEAWSSTSNLGTTWEQIQQRSACTAQNSVWSTTFQKHIGKND